MTTSPFVLVNGCEATLSLKNNGDASMEKKSLLLEIEHKRFKNKKLMVVILTLLLFPLNAETMWINPMIREFHCYNYGSAEAPLTLGNYISFAKSEFDENLEMTVKTAFETLKEAAVEANAKLRELPHIRPFIWKKGTPSCSEEDYFHESPCQDLREAGKQIVDSFGYKEEIRSWQNLCRGESARQLHKNKRRDFDGPENWGGEGYYVFEFHWFEYSWPSITFR